MALFKSHKGYRNFSDSIRNKYRYAFGKEAVEFLIQLEAKLREDPGELKQGTTLCRAQLGHDYRPLLDDKRNIIDEVPCAFKPQRMKPLKDRAKDGRVNPKGIPCLYLSTNRETAIAEIKPATGQYVSVGYFEINKDCKLANLVIEKRSRSIYIGDPPEDKIEEIVLGDVTYAFSRPVQSDEQTADYAPTQVIAEHLRRAGFDGIYYRSNLGPGMNIALFDIDAADLKACDLFEIGEIKYAFSLADSTYHTNKKKLRKKKR
jgi:hypothetical protein